MMRTLRKGDRGKLVATLQGHLGVAADARPRTFGPVTHRAVLAFQRARGLHPDGIVGPNTWEAIQGTAAARPSAVVAPAFGPMLVGAWCGATSLKNPARDVAIAVEAGLGRLDIIVNDHSKARAGRAFQVRNVNRIKGLAAEATAAGLEVHLMSWLMPHEAYIRGAAKVLIPLAEEVGAKAIQWDAEEPWTHATGGMGYPEAAALIAEVFAGRACEMHANGIGYTPVDKFGPLAAVCDRVIVQAYSTATSGVKPERVDALAARWEKQFATTIDIGLACYRQDGIDGHTEASALQTAMDEVRAAGYTTAVYWHLDSIRRDKGVRAWFKGRA